jgi:hypothetical protein
MTQKPSVTLPATVEKVLTPEAPELPEKAQIAIEGADELYRQLRVDNVLTNQNGEELKMREGAKVDVTLEADPKDTKKA